MTNENCISLELSKKLKEEGCDLESEYIYHRDKDLTTCKFWFDRNILEYSSHEKIKAYDILYDICIKYRKEFFGSEQVCDECGNNHFECESTDEGHDGCDTTLYCEECNKEVEYPIPAWEFRSREILYMLQQNKKQKAEDYIWNNCLFNKKNKEEK